MSKESSNDGTKGKKYKPKHYPRIRYEELTDIDYLDKLPPDKKAYIEKFMNEYINASFDEKDNIHNKDQELDCYDRNNARNRDWYSRKKAINAIVDIEEANEAAYNPEDELNYQIDVKKRKKKKKHNE